MKLLIFIIVTAALIAPSLSLGAASGDAADTPEAIQKQLDAATDAREKALLHKRLGDILAEQDDYSRAAVEYEAALATSGGFSQEERLQMVVRISLADKVDSATKHAQELVADKPDYSEARVTLARLLSWQGHLDDSIAEADRVLKAEPHNRGALLVKADALRWKGDKPEAMAIYRALLTKEEFGPRLGLAYTQIAAGDLSGARESLHMLKPTSPSQLRDVKTLEGAIEEAAKVSTGTETQAASGDAADTPEAIQKQLDAATDAREKALLHKRLGDILAEQDDYSRAAVEYEAALATPGGFSQEERLQMVVRISLADKVDSATKHARELVADKPDYSEARVTLARLLSWQGHLDDSIAEADRVLKAEPHNRGALLVKADALRWRGDKPEAMAIYRTLLTEEEFGPRLGLAYTQIAAWDLSGARESLHMLKPKSASQERDVKALEKAIEEAAKVSKHQLSLRSSYYSDTDNNDVNRYGALYTYKMSPSTELGAEYLHTYARDPVRAVHMNSLNIQGTTTVGSAYALGATAGLHQIDQLTDHSYVSWGASAEGPIWKKVTLSAGVAKDVLSDTAQIIENGIRVLSTRASLTIPLYDRLSLFAGYSWREYSDSNHANDVTISPTYALLTGNPNLRVGYRFRYLDFERQSGGGYFDPNNFISHSLVVSYDHEIGPWHLTFEPYGGFQSFDRYGVHTDYELFGGVNGTVAYKINRLITLEASGEVGNYALGSASGFEYYVVNGRILFSF